tara:strand:- start:1199 stop:2140 length:942 start_codon:yes stop_codon:yes gene_type:complete
MKIEPIDLLLKKDFIPSKKKFYFISGNEVTLIQKIKTIIIEKYQEFSKASLEYVESINDVSDGIGLFEDKKIFIVKNCNGLDENNLEKFRETPGIIIFIQENSPKIKKIKNIFIKDRDSYVIDCYELNREAKIKILNEYLISSEMKMEKNLYWFLIERLSGRFGFFDDNLRKVLQLKQEDINFVNIKKLISINEDGKDKLYFSILNKNKDIIGIYREKILTSSDVNELYYYCKFFCQLIIDSKNEDEYNKKIPIYLFKEKRFLIDIYRRFNSKKKKLLVKLLSSTEKILRTENNLSLVSGLRFLLSIKKITTS